MGSYDGKVVIVTGGAKGIGEGISEGFAAEGAAVALADVDADAAGALESRLRGAGRRAQAVIGDVGVAADCRRIVAETVAAFGGVDVLVNNAGIQPPSSYKNAEDTPEELWDRIIDVNLKAQFLMAKYAIPEMRARGGGVILNVASVQGLQSMQNVPAYAASKGGSLSLTRNLALDYARENIRVLAICPGSVDSPMLRTTAAMESSDTEEVVQRWGRGHPIGRLGRPEDIAHAAVFLASPKAGFMTGEYVCVDGGYMAQGAWAAGAGS